MDGSALKTLTTSLLGGFEMDDTLFYSLLNIAKGVRENQRDWMKLKKSDITKTATTGDNFQTSKALPSDFSRWQKEKPMVLYDSGNTQTFREYFEIPQNEKILYQTDNNRFYVDYTAMLAYLTGTVDRTYLIAMNYLIDSPDIAAGTSWIFPTWAHPLLAYDVAANYKGGIDFDFVNMQQAASNKEIAKQIEQGLIKWDASLQVGSLRGVDRNAPGSSGWQGRRVNNGSTI